jgi:hypothetical protein
MNEELKPWQMVNRVISDMREIQRQAESNANTLVDLLANNLKHVSPYRLARLKKELSRFDACKKEWKP